MIEFNFFILDQIQQLRSPILDTLMVCITTLGNAGFIWILIGLFLFWKGHKKTAYIVFLALIIELILCNGILKPLVNAVRPFELNTAVEMLIPKPTDPSFPSGHTAASFCVAVVLYLCKEKYWPAGLIIAVLIAFSRLYLYVHFPTDVLGGILVGILSAVFAYMAIQKYGDKLSFLKSDMK